MAKKKTAKKVARSVDVGGKKAKKLARSFDELEESMHALGVAEKDLANVRANMRKFLDRAEKILSGFPTIQRKKRIE